MILQIYDSKDLWIQAALDVIVSVCSERKAIHLCLSGGTTPRPVYEALASDERFRALSMSKAVHLWVGDEREAPAQSGLRNSEMIADAFRESGFKDFAFREPKNAGEPKSPAPETGSLASWVPDTEDPGLILHAWPAGPRETAAPVYEKEFLSFAKTTLNNGQAFFDLSILGMGEDGHTAGLFAAQDLSRAVDSLVMLTRAPQNPKGRMTMTPRALLSSGKILVLMRGLPKVRLLMSNLFGDRSDPIHSFLTDQCEVIAQL